MFQVNDRAVINMPDNKFYHNQVVRILKVFPHQNAFAARIRTASGGERTLMLDKLLPFQPLEPSAPDGNTPPQHPPKLPGWAWQGTELRQGCDLKAGDTVYFSAKANPRKLDYRVSDTEWKGWAVSGSHHIATTVYVSPSRWYLVKAAR